LPDSVQSALKEGKISMGHARAIINVEDPQKQEWMLEQMLANELSVRDVENLVRENNQKDTHSKIKTASAKSKSTAMLEFQQQLSDKFNTKIAIKADEKGRGSIKIPFRSQADLQRILDLMGSSD
jgi:ParB family chromosome partitioning protein